VDKGRRNFKPDRKPDRPSKRPAKNYNPGKSFDARDKIADAEELSGATDKIEGRNAVTEALAAGREFNKIWILKPEGDRPLDHGLIRILDEANKKGIIVTRATRQVLDKMSHTHNHQGVIAFMSPVTYQRLDQIVPMLYEEGKDPFIVVLDRLTDVRNFGAIARTCACAGVDAIVIPMNESVTVNADAIKTSAGALHSLPVCRESSLREALRFMKDSGIHLVAATEKASESYTNAQYQGPLAIVMGSEDEGIAVENLRVCDELVQIPMRGNIASLNVSVAAGIMIYEAIKQR
jgi:23S rRNA (guanosine2251-2'-O)-methyltransferase